MPVSNPTPKPTDASRLSENPNDERLSAVLEKTSKVARQTQSRAYTFFRCDDGSLLEVRALHDRETWFFTEVDAQGRPTAAPVQHGDGSPVSPPPKPPRVQRTQAEIDFVPETPPETPPQRHWWANRRIF